MTSRINLLNARPTPRGTASNRKWSTYIALYAADDDSLTASVEDYRYYLDELASLTQLAAVAATDANTGAARTAAQELPDHQTRHRHGCQRHPRPA